MIYPKRRNPPYAKRRHSFFARGGGNTGLSVRIARSSAVFLSVLLCIIFSFQFFPHFIQAECS